MADENIIARVTQARADLKKMRDMVERCYAILCHLTGWNPKEGMSAEEENAQQNDPTYRSKSRELVKLLDEDLDDLKKARATVDAATIESCKAYAKKIAQLTHPDKIMRFSAHNKAILLDLFHQSHQDLADNNHAGLIYTYIHIRIVRGESRFVDPVLFEIVESELTWATQQIQFILRQPYIPAANAYCDGKIPVAKMLFLEYIEGVRQERKRQAAMREMMAEAKRENEKREAARAEEEFFEEEDARIERELEECNEPERLLQETTGTNQVPEGSDSEAVDDPA